MSIDAVQVVMTAADKVQRSASRDRHKHGARPPVALDVLFDHDHQVHLLFRLQHLQLSTLS